jgi:integrase/recombinase XerD
MTPLREQMIRELELQRKPDNTIKPYVGAVEQLAGYYHRSPDRISVDEIRSYFHDMISQRRWAFSTCNQKLAGIRFFYREVLKRPDFKLRIPTKRNARRIRPEGRPAVQMVSSCGWFL